MSRVRDASSLCAGAKAAFFPNTSYLPNNPLEATSACSPSDSRAFLLLRLGPQRGINNAVSKHVRLFILQERKQWEGGILNRKAPSRLQWLGVRYLPALGRVQASGATKPWWAIPGLRLAGRVGQWRWRLRRRAVAARAMSR